MGSRGPKGTRCQRAGAPFWGLGLPLRGAPGAMGKFGRFDKFKDFGYTTFHHWS